MVDGEIVAAVQEERFTGRKGEYGLPLNAVAYCLRQAGVAAADIDEVVLASHNWNPVLTKVKRNSNFKIADWVKEQHEYWKPVLLEGRDVSYYDLFAGRNDFVYDDVYPMDHLLRGYMDPAEMDEMRRIRLGTVAERLGVPVNRVRTVTHEDCHTFYAYFGSPLRGRTLALTAEGIGDYSNGTVSEFSEDGRRELASTRENHIGHIYQYITLLLGMKPADHEYKVMGLAPYANSREIERSFRVFERILTVDGLRIVWDERPADLYFHFRDALEGHRFDGIAGAVQRFVEELLCRWVAASVGQTGLGRIVFSGGVAQNIKACKVVAELPGVDDLYVCPASGDTSLPIGACYFAMWEHVRKEGLPVELLRPIDDVYLGPSFANDEIDRYLADERIGERYVVERGAQPERIAQLLADGAIVARSVGRMEFGLRALGNRSILADPRRPETVRRINDAIKFRDFWMPFTPSILAERAADYVVNPKGLRSPFMTLAFDSTELARRDLPAAMHPGDQTIRPQLLESRRNPAYHALIRAFEERTGVGAVLNTSFNLHGHPIALGPAEALFTLDNSDLDALVLGDFVLTRR